MIKTLINSKEYNTW